MNQIFLADEENKAGSNAKTQIQYNYNTAVGSRAVAGGTGNTAIGFATITGSNSQNDNSQATAIGYRSFAQGKESTAVGNDAVAWGHGAISIGSDNIPSGKYNRPLSFDTWLLFRHDRENFNYTADYLVIKYDNDMDKNIGERNKKIQDYFKTRRNADEFKDEYQEYLKDWDKQQNKVINGSANTDGKDPTRTHTWARGQGSIALGSRSIAFDDFTTAVGTLAIARGKHSTAIGSGTLAYGEKSLAIGNEAYVYYDNGIAIGNNVQALSDQSMVYGRDAYASGKGSLAIGSYAYANVALSDDYWKLLNIYEGESDYLTMNQFLNQNLPEALAKENVQSWFKPKMELQEG
ncbi:hypothetical protein ACE4RU_03015 [Actinobacillus seminis]|uniref:hypothetical protein n=1 Tax=Actinobacillus seminis TaxID=722 RepID=UPI003B95DFBC